MERKRRMIRSRRLAPACLALLLVLGTVYADPAAAQAGSPLWSTPRHDNQRSGRSPVVAAQEGSLLFAPRPTGSSSIPSAAAEGPDGSVYFSNRGALRAVDPASGALLWSIPATGGRVFSAPVVGPDGTVVASQTLPPATAPALVTAFHADGTPSWTYTTAENVAYFSDLLVDDTGRVFGRYLETQFTSWHLIALDAAGSLLWKTSRPYTYEFTPTAPALLADGDLVITAVDGAGSDRLMRFDETSGALVWSVHPGGSLSGPVVADNGLVLVHSPGVPPLGGVHAFDPASGAPAWTVPYFYTEYGEDNPPVLLANGEIVAIANGDAFGNRVVYRISPSGSLIGTAPYPSTGYYTDAVAGGDDTIYIWTSMRLLAFSPQSGAVTFDYFAAPTSTCLRAPQPTILSDGSIFVCWQRKQTCDSPAAFGEYVTLAPPALTVSAALSCAPASGTVPFVTVLAAALINDYPGQHRLLAGRIDVTTAAGGTFSNWRSGYANVDGGSSFATTWSQPIPALDSLIGVNTFQLVVFDVTPSPFNQPPYPPAGDTATDACTVTVMAP